MNKFKAVYIWFNPRKCVECQQCFQNCYMLRTRTWGGMDIEGTELGNMNIYYCQKCSKLLPTYDEIVWDAAYYM